jgi:glyoxylase-like metal-dependent hydrolase (beta-lactamase superfamily II)
LIIPLHAGNPSAMTGSGNWTYFLPGHHPLLIDAGVGEATHIAAIAERGADGPHHVLVTHAHSDHISGVTAIAKRWAQTTFSKYPWADRDQYLEVQLRPLHE